MVARSMEEESSMEEAKAVAKAVVEKTMKAATTEPRAYVHQSLSEFHLHSNLKRRADVPAITLSDLVVKDKLGAGGFALVTAVEMNGQQYAMKALKPSTVEMKDKRKFAIAASDLWKEAEFLASLHHPHIVDIHGMHMEEDSLDTNFLVLDRLEETLEHKMTAWRAAHVMAKPKARQHLLYERLEVCLDIAQTMQYLHDENVIYRDLKAENLGFDAEGTVKLFDFGLAKELKDDDKANGKYQLSGETGSLAYMAPEVAKGWKYDRLVDVYSFSILMWEICALQPAFLDRKTKDDMHAVWNGDVRPPMVDTWPVELQWLLKKCWAYFSKTRPDFSLIAETLQEIIDDEEEEEDSMRGIKSFRFGSRRSQKLSVDSHEAQQPRRRTLRPRDLTSEKPQTHKKFFGIF